MPFATEGKSVSIDETYEHMKVTKSLEKAKGKVRIYPRKVA